MEDETHAESQYSFECPFDTCPFISVTAKEWLTHLCNTHQCQRHFQGSCCFNNCLAGPFNSFSALKSHFYRKHFLRTDEDMDEVDTVNKEDNEYINEISLDQLTCTFESSNDITNSDTVADDIICLMGLDSAKQKRESALYLMRLKEVCRLSQTSIDEVVTGC